MEKDIFQEMADKWPSAVVARTQINNFTGGMMSGKYLANLDSQGAGPERITCGRRVAYPIDSLVTWLRERSV
jgi:hypothetical protein